MVQYNRQQDMFGYLQTKKLNQYQIIKLLVIMIQSFDSDHTFWEWSIFNFFIHDSQQHFQHQWSKLKDSCEKGQVFLTYLQNYLINFCKIRGKWIKAFNFSAKEFKQWQETHKPKQSQFFQFLNHLELNQENLIFLQFILKFFQFSILTSFNDQQAHQLTMRISQIYFQYRICLTYNHTMIDAAASPAMVQFIKLILQHSHHFHDLFNPQVGSQLSPFQNLAIQCQFQHLCLEKLKSLDQHKNLDKINVEKDNTKKAIEFSTPINLGKISSSSQKTAEKSKIQQNSQLQCKVKQVFQNKKQIWKGQQHDEYEVQRSVKSIIHKRNMKKNQTASKIIKTTRHFNFKGIFKKKSKCNDGVSKVTSIETSWHKIHSPQSKKVRQKVQTNMDEDYGSTSDYLCDKSF